jgi:hypothetical protein
LTYLILPEQVAFYAAKILAAQKFAFLQHLKYHVVTTSPFFSPAPAKPTMVFKNIELWRNASFTTEGAEGTETNHNSKAAGFIPAGIIIKWFQVPGLGKKSESRV